MMAAKRIGGLEIQQDLVYQRHEWRFERVGWVVMMLILLLALLGLLGGGPLARRTATNPEHSVRLHFDRFLRFHCESRLQIEIDAVLSSRDEIRLWFDREFCDKVQLVRITPTPNWEAAGPAHQVFAIRVAERGRPLRIAIYFDPDQIGAVMGCLHIDGAEPVAFKQFTYP